MSEYSQWGPRPDPMFGNPDFAAAPLHVLIVRLSPFRDVDRSTSHLFLFDAVRRAEPRAFIDFSFFPLLTGIQSCRPAKEFDLILVSNSFVLEMLNLPYMLRHSGWPVLAGERAGKFPPLILGGSNASAAQSLVPFVDGIFVGEAEEAIADIVRTRSVKPVRVKLMRPRADLLPLRYPILNSPEAGTARLQITYGCPSTCSFCFEGFDRKPYRELPAADLIAHARLLKQRVGCEEIDLASFNFNTHTDIARLIVELNRVFDRVTFKSQRVDILAQTPWLLPLEIAADKRSFTLGIEGISERLRAFLNKSLPTADIRTVLQSLLRERIREIKLFYILTGHETDADLAEFREFVRWLKEKRRAANPNLRVVFSAGFLVRMPGTPLEHDRLFLDEADFKPILGPVKSACETNNFEFRLAASWTDYAATQVLALGGKINPDADICYDTALPPSAWEQIKTWRQPHVARLKPLRPTKSIPRKLRPPENLPAFRELMARKARLKPFFVRLRVPPEWSGATTESLNARIFAHLLQQDPKLTDNLLSVREATFTPRGWRVTGETVFALKAWNNFGDAITTNEFRQAVVELRQPGIGARVQEWLRTERLAFSARRDGNGYRLELSADARKKRAVFDAYVETDFARLTIGPKCRLDLGQIHVTALEL